MKTILSRFAFALPVAAFAAISLSAQTTPKPVTASPKAATTTSTKPAARKPSPTSTAAASTAMKLPANIPVVRGVPKSAFALKYIDAKLGNGAAAQPGWKYSVHYTGWLHDGTKFDSSVDRGTPIDFVQGAHRVITGWDDGFEGMHVGGKRRLFIPYQLAYGAAGRGPIPPKADLIFDIELVAQSDPNAPPPAPPAAVAPPAASAPPAKTTTPQ